ncbi:MAG: hypothetical protein IJV24_01555 [Prevotella sp.]|nr:hypothetical protein [Prevotella sp.]
MKYYKLLLLLLLATLTACDSDDEWNTSADVFVSMANETITVKENAGFLYVPVKVSGAHRNGDVRVSIAVQEVGDSPAVADIHYLLTSPSVVLPLGTDSVGVELKLIDDEVINTDRQFAVTIRQVDGAALGASVSTMVTLRDNDANFYERFFGRWTMRATMANQGAESLFEKEIRITGEMEETARDYDHILTVSATDFINIGIDLDAVWHMRYSFVPQQKRGTLAFIMNEQIASYGDVYSWVWKRDKDMFFSDDDLTAEWQLGPDDAFPDVVEFGEDQNLYFYQPGQGSWRVFTNISLTRKR